MSSVTRSTCEGDPDVEATAEVSRSLKRDKFESDSYSDSYLEAIKLAMMSLFKNEPKLIGILIKPFITFSMSMLCYFLQLHSLLEPCNPVHQLLVMSSWKRTFQKEREDN